MVGLLITANFASAGDAQDLAKKRIPGIKKCVSEMVQEIEGISINDLWNHVACMIDVVVLLEEKWDGMASLLCNESDLNKRIMMVWMKGIRISRRPDSFEEKKVIIDNIAAYYEKAFLKKMDLEASHRKNVIADINTIENILNQLDDLKNRLEQQKK